MRLAVLLAICSACSAEDLRLSKNGVGPVSISTQISVKKGKAHIVASARNESGRPIRSARFTLRSTTRSSCAFDLWTTREWAAGETWKWDITLSSCKGDAPALRRGRGARPAEQAV
jgi:hypothetical protein